MAQMVKNLPTMQETQVHSLDWEDPLEEVMAAHSSIAWRIPQTEESGGLQPIGLRSVRHDSSDLVVAAAAEPSNFVLHISYSLSFPSLSFYVTSG